MKYSDKLYGNITLPDYIGEIMETPLFQRLKDISNGVLPRSVVTWPLASRFEHSVGVCHLMNLALRENRSKLIVKSKEPLLLVSALLHDAGNPALSHLSEPFLKKLNGKDGESFLEDTIARSLSFHVFESLGITPKQIVRMVTGSQKPFSEVLNGSMDVDNLDNVGRYWFTRSGGEKLFDGQMIALSYCFMTTGLGFGKEWILKCGCVEEAKKWQDARKAVYEKIYGEPDLNAAMMIYRAVYLAQELGEISEEFFHLSDTEAIEYLLQCNEWSSHLARRTMEHKWYQQVYCLETTEPSENFVRCCNMDNFRSAVANYIREQLKIPNSMVCAYAGKGKDVRKITLPFWNPDATMSYDESDPKTIYRFKVYIDLDYVHKAKEVEFWANYLIS